MIHNKKIWPIGQADAWKQDAEEQKKTGIPRVNIINVLTQSRVRTYLTDTYVAHTTKSDICFGVCQPVVTLLGVHETKQVILIVDLSDFLVDTHKNICEHM